MNNETITAREFLTNMFNLDFLAPEEVETIITAMELYAKGKAKEQRKLCHDELVDESDELNFEESLIKFRQSVLNAPEPLFELNLENV